MVTCPRHQPRFDVCSGAVENWPATFLQARFMVRECDRRAKVKLTDPTH